MKRVTVTLPDDLEASPEEALSKQDTPPGFASLMQEASKEHLLNKRLEERDYQSPRRPFYVEPLEEKDNLGEPEVSINHDAYLGYL